MSRHREARSTVPDGEPAAAPRATSERRRSDTRSCPSGGWVSGTRSRLKRVTPPRMGASAEGRAAWGSRRLSRPAERAWHEATLLPFLRAPHHPLSAGVADWRPYIADAAIGRCQRRLKIDPGASLELAR